MQSPTLKQQLSKIYHTLTEVWEQLIELFSLEAKLALRSLCVLVGLFFAGGILIAVTWMMLAGCAFIGLLKLGISWPVAFLIMFFTHVLLLMFVLWAINVWKKNLFFNATRRQLMLSKGISYENQE